MDGEVQVTVKNGVKWISLFRPESKNGLTEQTNTELISQFESAQQDRSIRTIVLTGSQGNFCSGLDLKAAMRSGNFQDIESRMRKYFHGLIRAIRAVSVPVIALVDGPAVGFGCDLALACDIRLGTSRAQFGEIFVRRGLMPDGGGTYFLPRLVGLGRALDLMLSGDIVPAEEAKQMGLISRILPTENVETAAWTFAEQIAKGPPRVHAWVKQAVYGSLSGTLDEALEREIKGQVELINSRDFAEGLAAFFDKRPPSFTGE